MEIRMQDGNAEAAYRVGMMHYAGLAGAGGESEAVRWLEQAMAGGHVLARYQLATMYAQVLHKNFCCLCVRRPIVLCVRTRARL